jgi:predicted permease
MDHRTLFRVARWQVRGLWRSRLYSAFVVLCLTLGLATTVTILAAVDASLVRPLPYRQPGELLLIWKVLDSDASRGERYFPHPADFEFLRREARHVAVAAQQPIDLDVLGEHEPERVTGSRVSGEFFAVLGVAPSAGRLIRPEDELQEAAVAVVERGFALRRFGAVRAALGRIVRVDGRAHEVVGVLPSDTALPTGAEIWIPLTRREFEGRLGVSVIGRLAPGQSARSAIAEIRRLGERLIEVDPVRNGSAGLDAGGLQHSLSRDARPTLLALLVAVALLFGVACANTAFLVVARARRRRDERALKEILGAAGFRIALESLLENGLLAALAGALALVLTWLAVPLLSRQGPVAEFSFMPTRVDERVVIGVFALAAAMTAILTLAALAAGRGPSSALRGGRRLVAGARVLGALLVLDVFLTTVLLSGAGAMLQTVGRLNRVDPGFAPDGLARVAVSASPARSVDHDRRVAFYDQVLEEIRAIPGVRSAAAVYRPPMDEIVFRWNINVEGRPPVDAGATEAVLFRVVTPDYLETLGMRLLEGRTIARTDGIEAPRVVLCNRAFAQRHLPRDEALGNRVKGGRYDAAGEWFEIVGVVGDVREVGLSQPVEPALYLPLAQWDRAYLSRMSLLVRGEPGAASPVPAVRERIRAIDPEAVLFDIEPMSAIVARTLFRHRFAMSLLAIFALLATVQAAAGIYGITAFDTASRRREIGLRLALGARPADVRRWVLVGGLRRSVLGLAPGLTTALALLWWGRSRWREVGVGDASLYLGVFALVTAVVIAATYLPARRAAAVDPARTLRAES